MLEAFWLQDAPKTRQDAPKTHQDAPKTLQDAPRRLQVAPRGRQDAPKTPQDGPRGLQDLPGFGKWSQNGAKLAPKSNKKLMLTSKSDFLKIELSLQRGLDFSGFGGRSWEQKSIKNRSENGIQDGMHVLAIEKRPKAPQDVPKTPPRRSKMPQDAPKMPPRRPKTHPRRLQEDPKRRARRPKTPQVAGSHLCCAVDMDMDMTWIVC